MGVAPLDIVLPGRGDTAVLLLHGLTGTPGEFRAVGEALADEGYTVRIPLLPGRGTTADDMDGLCWEDWMAAALASYDDLAQAHAEVVVGGVSAGATMALDLALRRRVAALLLYSAVLSIAHRAAYLAPYVWRLVRRWPSPPSDFVDREAALRCYDPAPVRAVSELIHGISRVRGRLGDIRAPALVVHAAGDQLVPLSSATELARRLGGPVRSLILDGTGHSITADARRVDVALASLAFLAAALIQPALRST